MRMALVFWSVLGILGCTPPPSAQSSDASTTAAGACVHEGDRCTFAEGKIGLCTAKPGCQGDGCLVCMSLH
jgi:hypothetical protein